MGLAAQDEKSGNEQRVFGYSPYGGRGFVILPWNRYILSVVVYAKATIWLLKIRYNSKQDKYM